MDGNTRGLSREIDLLTSDEEFRSCRNSISSLLNSTAPAADPPPFFDSSVAGYLQDGVPRSQSTSASLNSAVTVENLTQLKAFNSRIRAGTNTDIGTEIASNSNTRGNSNSPGMVGSNGRANSGSTSAGSENRLCVDSSTAKVGKKRSRASRRAPTTVLTTDTSNFRAMVQEFTGIPTGPFPGSATFPRNGIDFLGARDLPVGSNFLFRPFAQPMVGPSVLPPFNNSSAQTVPYPPNFLLQSLLHQQHHPKDSFSFPAASLINNIKAPPVTGGLLDELGLNSSAAARTSSYQEANLRNHLPSQWSNACNIDWAAARNIMCYNKPGGEPGDGNRTLSAFNSDERAVDLQDGNNAGASERVQVDSWISSTDQSLDKLNVQ